MYRSLALLVTILPSMHIATAQAQSVYVAPGGIYVQSAQMYVRPDPYAAQAYGVPGAVYGPTVPPGYVAPGAAYVAPGPGYVGPGAAYVAPGAVYAEPTYVAPVPAPGAVYGPPGAIYAPPGAIYAPPPADIEPQPAYYVTRGRAVAAPLAYAQEIVPRPPAAVPNGKRTRCDVILANGRRASCN